MTGMETVLLSGGAQWIISKLADEISGEVTPEVKKYLSEKQDVRRAYKAAEKEEIDKEFRRVLRQFEEKTGVAVEDYALTFPAADAQ